MIRRPVGHAESGRRAVVDTVRDAGQSLRGHHHFVGERAVHLSSRHPVADGEIACPVGYFDDDAGELAADHERRRDADLVLVGDEQDVGVVDRGRADAHPHLPGIECLRRPLLDPDDLGRPVLRAHRGANHV